MIDVTTLQRGLRDAATSGSVTLRPYRPASQAGVNEYCLFLKPELTELGDRLAPVLQLISDVLAANQQEVVAAAAHVRVADLVGPPRAAEARAPRPTCRKPVHRDSR